MRMDIMNGVPKDTERWLYEALHSLALTSESQSLGLAAIIRGESPDGSGTPLFNDDLYFKLLGRPNNQIGAGGTTSGGLLTLTSTAHNEKGFVYLGTGASRVAFDETQVFLGVGTDTPTARLHAHLLSTGTTAVNQLGTHFAEFSVIVSAVLKNILALAAYSNNASSFDVAFVSGGSNPVNGIGSIYFTDFNATGASGTGMRFAYGVYGSDTVNATHLQFGGLDNAGVTKNRNALLCGFNDNCGTQMVVHTIRFDIQAEGDNLTGTVRAGGGFFSNTNIACIGINSPSVIRTGTSQYDQPVVVIGDGSWFGTQYDLALRLDMGTNVAGTDNAIAKKEIMAIRGNSGRTYAIDNFGRMCFYNPGNGALTSRIGGRTQDFMVEDAAAGGTAAVLRFGLANTNSWSDGAAKGVYQMRFGFLQSAVRWAIMGCDLSAGEMQPFDRLGLQAKMVFICDALTTPGGTFTPPTAMLHVKDTTDNALVVCKIETSRTAQTANMMQIISAVSGTVDTVFNARNVMETGRIKTAVLFTNDNATIANSRLLGLSTSLISQGTTRTLTATDRNGNIATDANVVVDEATGNPITYNGDLVLA
jgi:hypothetical protein